MPEVFMAVVTAFPPTDLDGAGLPYRGVWRDSRFPEAKLLHVFSENDVSEQLKETGMECIEEVPGDG